MIFYLGTHLPGWLRHTTTPLFISRRRLAGEPPRARMPGRQAEFVRAMAANRASILHRRTLPVAAGPWVLDSGGFTELGLHGGWSITVDQYAAEVNRCRDEIGRLEWAAPMDWMCEPSMLARTGLSVADHQRLTIDNYLRLRDATDGTVIPVLQGWTVDDYLRHADAYQRAGVCLTYERVVGVGSVCRRGQDREIHKIVTRIAADGIRIHAFGVRSRALAGAAYALASADSMAWSYAARRAAPLPGHTHKTCANCRVYAEQWHADTIARLQSTLFA